MSEDLKIRINVSLLTWAIGGTISFMVVLFTMRADIAQIRKDMEKFSIIEQRVEKLELKTQHLEDIYKSADDRSYRRPE
jgi:hypothetical protein